MKNKKTAALDDGQPLVDFAPLKPAEFALPDLRVGAILQSNVGIANATALQKNVG